MQATSESTSLTAVGNFNSFVDKKKYACGCNGIGFDRNYWFYGVSNLRAPRKRQCGLVGKNDYRLIFRFGIDWGSQQRIILGASRNGESRRLRAANRKDLQSRNNVFLATVVSIGSN